MTFAASSAGQIRPARTEDIPSIEALLLPYVELKIVLPRSREQILKDLPLTWVYEQTGGSVAAVANLLYFETNLVEVRGLVVKEEEQKNKVGSRLVSAMLDYLRRQPGPITVFALTYSAGFFKKLGFQIVPKEKFPRKIYEVCAFCPKQSDCQEDAVELVLP